jgi:hypothetical protein
MRVCVGFGLMALSSLAFSEIIWEQGPSVDAEGGAFSVNEQQLADSFDVATDVTVRHATWWGSFLGSDPALGDREFNVSILTNFEGKPFTPTTEAVLATYVFAGMDTASGETVYRFDADLSGFNLTGGNTYWISIVDPQPGSQFRWHNGDGAGSASYFSWNGSDWQPIGDPVRDDMAVRLSTVPEPATLVALSLGAALLVRRKRRR